MQCSIENLFLQLLKDHYFTYYSILYQMLNFIDINCMIQVKVELWCLKISSRMVKSVNFQAEHTKRFGNSDFAQI